MKDGTGDAASLYEAWLLKQIVGAVKGGVKSFDELVSSAGGADPSVVRDTLFLAVNGGYLDQSAVALADAGGGCCSDEAVEPTLPPAHPLDFEWRFSRRGAEYLLETLEGIGAKDVCCVASTTVALLAASRGWQGRLISIDANPLVLDSAQRLHPKIDAMCLDVTKAQLPMFEASAVITDPPWYPEYLDAFLWASTKFCAEGGHVLLVLPGEGTRPSINADRQSVLENAALFGLEITKSFMQAVSYETPLFERNALVAAGVKPPARFWRKADLVVLRRTRLLESDRPSPPSVNSEWVEVYANRTRIRFRRRTMGDDLIPELRSIVPGDVLPTVSRRDPRRARVDVWTSGNRVYACERPDILHAIAVAANSGLSALEAVQVAVGRKLEVVERQSVLRAKEQFIELVQRESEEQAVYDHQWN